MNLRLPPPIYDYAHVVAMTRPCRICGIRFAFAGTRLCYPCFDTAVTPCQRCNDGVPAAATRPCSVCARYVCTLCEPSTDTPVGLCRSCANLLPRERLGFAAVCSEPSVARCEGHTVKKLRDAWKHAMVGQAQPVPRPTRPTLGPQGLTIEQPVHPPKSIPDASMHYVNDLLQQFGIRAPDRMLVPPANALKHSPHEGLIVEDEDEHCHEPTDPGLVCKRCRYSILCFESTL